MSRIHHASGRTESRTLPGERLRQRGNHLARQAIYNAIRRLRAGEAVELALHGHRYRVVPMDSTEMGVGTFSSPEHVLYVHHGRICFGWEHKNECRYGNNFFEPITPRKVLGRVVEELAP